MATYDWRGEPTEGYGGPGPIWGRPASVRYNNPGAQYPGASARRFGATHTETIGGGHKIAVFPDPVSGAAAQFDLLDRGYAGMTLGAAITKWSGGNSSPAYVSRVARETGLAPDTVITPALLRSPQGVQLARAMAGVEAGRPYPLSDQHWQAAQRKAYGDGSGAPDTTGSVVSSTPQSTGQSMPVTTVSNGPQQQPAATAIDPALLADTKRQQAMAQLLLQNADPLQARSPWEAAARAFQGIGGAYLMKSADDKEQAKQKAMIGLLGGQNLSPVEQYALLSGNAGAALPRMLDIQKERAQVDNLRRSLLDSYGPNITSELRKTIETGNLEALKAIQDQRIKNTLGDQKDSATQAAIKRNFENLKRVWPDANPDDLKIYAEQIANQRTVTSGQDNKITSNWITGKYLNKDTNTAGDELLPFDPKWRQKQPGYVPNSTRTDGAPPLSQDQEQVAVRGAGEAPVGYGQTRLPGSIDREPGSVPLTGPAMNEAQKDLKRLNDSRRQYDEVFAQTEKMKHVFTYGDQAVSTGQRVYEKITGSKPTVGADPAERAEYITKIKQMFNDYRVSVTGAAASEGELRLLEESFANRNMSHSEFVGVLRGLMDKDLATAQARYDSIRGGLKNPGEVSSGRSSPATATVDSLPPPLPGDPTQLNAGAIYRLRDGRKVRFNGADLEVVE